MFDIFQTIFKYKEKASPDKLGFFPEKVHVEAMPERRYLWTSRILVIISCMSICFSMILACTIYLLLPQRGAYPRLLQTNPHFSQLELTERQERSIPVQDLLAEKYIEEYIIHLQKIKSFFNFICVINIYVTIQRDFIKSFTFRRSLFNIA